MAKARFDVDHLIQAFETLAWAGRIAGVSVQETAQSMRLLGDAMRVEVEQDIFSRMYLVHLPGRGTVRVPYETLEDARSPDDIMQIVMQYVDNVERCAELPRSAPEPKAEVVVRTRIVRIRR